MLDLIKQLDTSLFLFLNRDCRNGFFDIIMPFITSRADVIVLPFLIFFFIKEKKKAFIIFAVSFFSVLLADVSANGLKHLIGRERPCTVLDNVHLLVGCSKSPSMPSNHTTNAFGFAVPFLIMTRNRVKYIFFFVAILVAFSRVFVGVHYPLDVIVGSGVGALAGMVVIGVYKIAERRYEREPHSTFMYVFLLVLSIFRIYYILDGPLDLSPDEAHYWEWARRLDLSYYSKGPMIAYLIALSTSIFGDNVLGVRFFAVVFSALSSLILYKLGKEMYSERVGATSAVIFQIIPLFSTFGVIFTIDSPFVFFWILSLWLFWEVTFRTQPSAFSLQSSALKYWLFLGVSVGLGLLTKYTMAFFYLCAFICLITSAHRRKVLKTGIPYIALFISVLIFSPVIIWNAQHGWVTLRHTGGQAHVADGLTLSIRSFIDFVGSQFGVVTPILFVMILIALWKIRGAQNVIARSGATKQSRGSEIASSSSRNDKAENSGNFLFWFSVPVIFFFALKSLQGKVQANWAMTGYITGLIAFSEIFVSRWEGRKRYLKNILIAGFVLSLVITAAAYYPSKFHIPLKLDPSARLRGWNELGKKVTEIYDDMPDKKNVFIFSDSYQVSSELAFYMKGHPITYCVNLGRRMNQYDLWPGVDRLMHYDGIFVTIDDAQSPPGMREACNNHEKHLHRVFEKDKELRTYSIFICRDFKGIKEEPIKEY